MRPTLVHLTAADVVTRPWKNGRGTTDELLLVPPDGDFGALDFEWRVARAGVDASGPFSQFAGFERVLVVVSGAGLRMEHGAAAPPTRVLRLHPYRFAGEWPTSAELLDGPVRDVNVLLRRDAVRGEVSTARRLPCERALRGSEAFVHALDGDLELRVGDAPTVRLAPGESLFVHGLETPTTCALGAEPGSDACALLVDVVRPGVRR